jgi:hypothetical protein
MLKLTGDILLKVAIKALLQAQFALRRRGWHDAPRVEAYEMMQLLDL